MQLAIHIIEKAISTVSSVRHIVLGGARGAIYLFILLYWVDSTAGMCPGKKEKITEIS